MNFHYLISNLLEPLSYGLCFLFFFIHARKNNSVKWKVLTTYYLLVTLLMVKIITSNPNIEFYSYFCLLSSIGIGIYFYYILLSRRKRAIVISFIIIQILYYVISNFLLPPPKVLDSISYVILSMSIVIMGFMYMNQLLSNITEEPLLRNIDFWFVSSQMVYYFGSFFIFLTYGYITQKILTSNLYSYENRVYISQLWRVHNVLLFLSSLIIATSVVWIYFRKKSPSSS